METNNLTVFFHAAPTILICLVGCALLVRNWAWQPLVCGLAIAGLATRLALVVSWVFYQRWIQTAFMEINDPEAMHRTMHLIAMAHTAVNALSLILLIAAVVVALRTIARQPDIDVDADF